MHARSPLLVALIAIVATLAAPIAAVADAPGNGAFQRTWAHTDKPVADLHVSRTWMWGPQANTPLLYEDYDQSPNGHRVVQYFDKSRMEITHPDGDPNDVWYVTNGLLVTELVTGQLQVGDARFEALTPAQVNVAGDDNDPDGPTYATFTNHLSDAPLPGDLAITQKIDRAGQVTSDATLFSYGVSAAYLAPETNHRVASIFLAFMQSSGEVYVNGQYTTERLFLSDFYATGLPITEAYWAVVRVAGIQKLVLVQCFQRRCLTYTPDNPEGWKVEAGNVGQHYYAWRYADHEPEPVPIPTTGNLRIETVFWDSPVSGEQSGEWLTIVNDDEHAVQLQGWRLTDDGAHNTYVFPDFVLPPGATVIVHTCTGTNTSTDLYTGGCNPWWNNDGDTANLYDVTGALVDSYSY